MDRGRKLRKHIFRILKPAALNGLTHRGKSQRHIALNDRRRGVGNLIFSQFWEVEERAEHLEPELLPSVA